MEESVALDSSKQKQFVKSVRGIKKLLKKGIKKVPKPEVQKKPKADHGEVEQTEKETEKPKTKNVKKRKIRGLVYLSHIPHGFYEHQMTEYFKQFGVVTNVRVIRSKRTGRSKGFAFIEFKQTAVAEIVAETMNNYLMGKRLLKAVYIPPKKQKRAFRKNWNSLNNPASEHKLKIKKAFNAPKTDVMELKIARKLLLNLSKTKAKLSNLGIEYNFMPVDIPEALKDEVEKVEGKAKDTSSKSENKSERKIKGEGVKVDNINNIKNETEGVKGKTKSKNKKVKETVLVKPDTDSDKKSKVKKETKIKKEVKVNKEEQTQKQNKLLANKIKLPENFISVKEDSGSDDEDFDSDEFEKMMNDDESISSGDESNESLDDESDESFVESDVSVVESDELDEPQVQKGPVNKGNKKKPLVLVAAVKKTNKSASNTVTKTKPEKDNVPRLMKKRKNVQNTPLVVAPKKVKFEKQNNKKTMKKVIKKKK